MAGSTYGTIFKLTTWGESHGKALGVVIDGCPSGLLLNEEDIQNYLDRRKPGQSKYTTSRKESDQVEILSGIFEGRTTGTPISLLVPNQDQHSKDYGNIAETYRPGHADYTFQQKYGFRDYKGGGRSSGRETIGRVAAGAVAAKILASLGVEFITYTKAIGPITVPEHEYDYTAISKNALYMPSHSYAEQAQEYLNACIQNLDSAGGIIECRVTGLPAGIGEPVFDKLDANLAKAIMSLGAVKGVEIGDGFACTEANGSTNNDGFLNHDGTITKSSNHSGGTLGGISDGSELILRAAVKPTPSIAQPQETIQTDGSETSLVIKGRHDPVIVPRAVVVVESMAAVTILDMLLINMNSKMEYLQAFIKKENKPC